MSDAAWVFEQPVAWQRPVFRCLELLGRAPKYLDELTLSEPLFRWNRHTAARAYELVERLYPEHYGRSLLPRWLAARRENDAVHLAYRKRLLVEIDHHLDYAAVIASLSKSLASRTVVFVPADPRRASGADVPEPARDAAARRALPGWILALGAAQSLLKTALLGARGLLHLAADAARSFFPAPRPEPAEFAVGIINPLREFANDLRWSGFFLDGKRLRPDNTLFVVLPPARLSPEQARDLSRRGLRLVRPSARSLRLLPGAALEAGVAFLAGWAGPSWLAAATWELLREDRTWAGFLERHPVRHFIAYSDFDSRHVGRNVALKRGGATTWYYADTTNTPDQFSARKSYREFHWGYLYYDRFVGWGERHVSFMRLHHQRIDRYETVGCLWSEHVRELLAGERASSLKVARAGRPDRGLPALAVFDGTYVEGSYSPFRVGVAFAEDMLRLLEERPKLCLIFKPKKPFHVVARLPGDAEPLKRAYAKLAEHPRCWLLDAATPAAEVIAEGALTIGLAFASPVLEALGARRKALFYDPNGTFPESYYDRVPNLVAHSREELLRDVDLWLGPEGDARLGDWWDRQLKPDVDSYLDGRGLTRFRELLAS